MNNIFVLLKTGTMEQTLARQKKKKKGTDKGQEQKVSKNVQQSTGVERKHPEEILCLFLGNIGC